MLNLTLLLPCTHVFSALFSIEIISLGEEVLFSYMFMFILHALLFCLFSLPLGVGIGCDL